MRATSLLLVDPDAGFATLLSAYLEAREWSVSWVQDGREALRRWAEIEPALVLTSLDGVDWDGFEFIEVVNRLAAPPPIVVCSQEVRAEDWHADTLSTLGVVAAVSRPVRFPALDATLRRALGVEGG